MAFDDSIESSVPNDELKNKRNRQIQIGKAAPAYMNYRLQVPLPIRATKQDLTRYPVTPRCNTPQVPSRTTWNQLVSRWKTRLHSWMPANNQREMAETISKKVTEYGNSSDSANSDVDISIPHKNPKSENELRHWEVYYYDLQQEEIQKNKEFNPQARLTTQINTQKLTTPLLGIEIDLEAEDVVHARNKEKDMQEMVRNLLNSQ
jgi:hypothetical protein